jgi:hypothetical protein
LPIIPLMRGRLQDYLCDWRTNDHAHHFHRQHFRVATKLLL